MSSIKTTQSIINYLFLLNRALTRLPIIRAKQEKTFSLIHFVSLYYIDQHGKLTMKDIAKWLKITPSSATSFVARLVDKGFLERKPDTRDRRIVYLQTTSRGKNFLQRFLQKRQEKINFLIARLNAKDQRTLLRILKELYTLTQEMENKI